MPKHRIPTDIARRDPDEPPRYQGELYARSRPRYPDELFDHLASLVRRRSLAWDCATGSGQAALSLASRFERVEATDISEEQLRHAASDPRVRYRVAPAHQSGLETSSVDLVTVAAAIHWFDLETFYAEARRVLRPGGVLAAWTYHVCYVEPPFDEVFLDFYRDVVGPYFPAGASLVDRRYETLELPGTPLPAPRLAASVEWSLDRLRAFVMSWTGTLKFTEEHGESPVEALMAEVSPIWGDPAATRTLRWPLYVRVARL